MPYMLRALLFRCVPISNASIDLKTDLYDCHCASLPSLERVQMLITFTGELQAGLRFWCSSSWLNVCNGSLRDEIHLPYDGQASTALKSYGQRWSSRREQLSDTRDEN